MEGELTTATGALVEHAPVAMAVFDRAMRYVLANRQWIREFGLQHVQPIVGRCQYDIFPNLHPGWREVKPQYATRKKKPTQWITFPPTHSNQPS